MQMGQNVMHDPHLVHMHWCPQSRHTVFDALRQPAEVAAAMQEAK